MYDPAQPNDYDDWLREAELRRKQREVDEQLQRKLAAADDERAAAEAARSSSAPLRRRRRRRRRRCRAASRRRAAGDPGLAMLQNMGWSEGRGSGATARG